MFGLIFEVLSFEIDLGELREFGRRNHDSVQFLFLAKSLKRRRRMKRIEEKHRLCLRARGTFMFALLSIV